MRFRRGVAALTAVALSAAVVGAVAPSASALEQPRLLWLDPGSVSGPDGTLLTDVGVAGAVTDVALVWRHALGDGRYQRAFTGRTAIPEGSPVASVPIDRTPQMLDGTWEIESVELTALDGSVTTVEIVDTPLEGGPGTTTTLSGGLTSLAQLAEGLPSLSLLETPGIAASYGSGEALALQASWSGATVDSPFLQVWASLGGQARTRQPIGTLDTMAASGTKQAIPSVPADAGFPRGTWRIDRVVAGGNTTSLRLYTADGTGTSWTSQDFVQADSGAGVQPGCVDVGLLLNPGCIPVAAAPAASITTAALDVTIADTVAARDLTPPALSAVSVSPAVVAPGSTFTVTATYTDQPDKSLPVLDLAGDPGAEHLEATFLRSCPGCGNGSGELVSAFSSGSPSCQAAAGGGRQCTVTATGTIPSSSPWGSFALRALSTTDAAGNRVDYGRSEVRRTVLSRVVDAVGPGDPDLSAVGFSVGAVDASAPTLTSFAVAAPVAIDITDAQSIGGGHLYTWTASDGSGTGVTRVSVIMRNLVSGDEYSRSWLSRWPATSGTVPGPAAGQFTSGDWIVRAVVVGDRAGNTRRYDADGTVSTGGTHSFDLASASWLAMLGEPPTGLPGPPRGLAVLPRTDGIGIAWTAPARTGSGVTGYQVVVEGAAGTTTQDVAGTSTLITGLVPGQGYTVAVRARTAAGTGPAAWRPSTAVELAAPLAPSITALVPVLKPAGTSASVSVAFTAAAPPAYGPPPSGYITQVRRAAPGAALPSTWTDSAVRASPSGGVASVARGSKLCVRVVAVNDAGRGTPSAQTCTVVMGDDRSLSRTSGWTRPSSTSAYMGTLTSTRTAGQKLTAAAAYGSALVLQARAVPGGGTVAVYRGTTLVGTWSLAASSARTVTASFPIRATGQKLTIAVTKAGTAGVAIDGWALRP